MTEAKQKEADQLHMELERLVLKLKHNREKVPLDVLKTKYAAGAQSENLQSGLRLCQNGHH